MPQGIRMKLSGGINLAGPSSELMPGQMTIARNCFYEPDAGGLRKWPGSTLFGTVGLGAAPKGLVFVRFRNGNAFLITQESTAFYTAPVGVTGSWTARYANAGGNFPLRAYYFKENDTAYLLDGESVMQAWSGSGNTRDAGLTRPSDLTLTFLSNSTTTYANNTTFQYCHTEYYSTYDIESAPSTPQQLAASAVNGTFKIALPTKTNASADKIRIYRTQHGGGIFFQIAEFAIANVRYYDGDDSEALGNSVDNDTAWGFKTVDDAFLATQNILPMIGTPILANYMTVNGTIPIAKFGGVFDGSLWLAGVAGYPMDLYFSAPNAPETFPPINYIRIPSTRGDEITGGAIATDRLIVFSFNGVYRVNTFPRPTDPGFGLGLFRFEIVTEDHGCVATDTIVPFGIGQASSNLFYLSARGPMVTDGVRTWPINEDLNWSSDLINFSHMSKCVAINFPKYQVIILWCPSKDSTVNDIAFVYHYHPARAARPGVGTWTGPLHKRCNAAVVSYDTDTETRLYVADTSANGKVYLEDNGTTDAQLYDNADGKILWEWETGDDPMGEESGLKQIQRIFLNVTGTDDNFAPTLYMTVDKKDTEHSLELDLITENLASTTTFGTSTITKPKTRTYRTCPMTTASHFKWHFRELAAGERRLASFEAEVVPFGRQR